MTTLWPFQEEKINEVRAALRQHRSVLFQSPTGSGKTQVGSYMLNRVREKQGVGFFICHRRELVDQTAATFEENGLPHGFIASGYPQNLYQPIQICSIDTLKNRVDSMKLRPSFVLWDECHHLGAAGWARVKAAYDESFHVGLSATPSRLDGTGLDDKFDFLVPGPPVSWLIDEGYLAKYKLYSVPGADLRGVHTKMGDFVKGESEKAMDKPKIVGNIIDHWKRYAPGMLTIGFAVTVRHSHHMVNLFNQAGIPAAHLDGETPKAERRQKLRDLAYGRIKVVWNVGLFGEGYDIAANSGVKGVTVQCVIDAAPTQSLNAWLQRCGRALRRQNNISVILDHSGNAMRHGLPCDDREWSLAGRPKGASRGSASEQEAAVSVTQCQKCYFVYRNSPACPECGHVNDGGRQIKEVEGELQEIDPAVARQQRKKEQGSAQSFDDLVALGEQRGVTKPVKWAERVIEAREEKARLRTSVHNLMTGLDSVGIDHGLTVRDVKDMKPKALKETIERLETLLKGGNDEHSDLLTSAHP